MRVSALLVLFWTGILWPSAGFAQSFEKICLPQQDAGDGASVAVDARNNIHFSRISRLSGALQHSVLYPDGRVVDAEIVRGVSLLAFNEVDSTQIVLEGMRPSICYHHAVDNTFEVAVRTDEGWQREVIHRGVGAGRWCSMIPHRRTLAVAFGSDDGRLRIALRLGRDAWTNEIIDEPDEAAGIDVSLTEIGGALVAAHQTEGDRLRVTWQLADGWQSQPMIGLASEAGVSPVALAGEGGELWIVHGTAGPPNTSDAGLLLTQGRLGMFRTRLVADDESGGSNGAVRVNGALAVTTRYFRRNAVFGDSDALRYYDNADAIDFFDALESSGSAQRRHRYTNVRMAVDRFTLPIIVALDESNRFQGERGTAFTCTWRPLDSDADAIPDDAEGRFGTDPEDPDTDGDGRLDGIEVLVHGTDPLVVDPVPPDMGVQPDLGIADFGIVDFDAAVDAGEDDAAVGPDAAAFDEGVVGDMRDADATLDASAIDQGADDRGLSDQGAGDQGGAGDVGTVDRGLTVIDDGVAAQDAEPVGFEPIEPPRIDAGDAQAGGGSGGCAQSPAGAPGSSTVCALLFLALFNRRRRAV